MVGGPVSGAPEWTLMGSTLVRRQLAQVLSPGMSWLHAHSAAAGRAQLGSRDRPAPAAGSGSVGAAVCLAARAGWREAPPLQSLDWCPWSSGGQHHVIYSVKFFISYAIPDVSKSTKSKIKREKYLTQKLLHESHLKDMTKNMGAIAERVAEAAGDGLRPKVYYPIPAEKEPQLMRGNSFNLCSGPSFHLKEGLPVDRTND
ncbi:hypothetical protein MC885_006296, partial [Smutsia gigantea]